MYTDVTKDFVSRTLHNLELVRGRQRAGDEAYEVTQLINSLLGLLVFPQQAFIDSIPYTPLVQLEADGWPVPPVVGNFPQVKTLNELVRYLRNAIAHFHVRFVANAYGHVRAVQLWNENRERVTWQTELSLLELEALTRRFCGLLLGDDATGAMGSEKAAPHRATRPPVDRRPRTESSHWQSPLVLDPAVEEVLHRGRLVYPACAADWGHVVQMFEYLIDEFVFIDPREFAGSFRPLSRLGQLRLRHQERVSGSQHRTTWRTNEASDRTVQIDFLAQEGEAWLRQAPRFHAFFLRRDTTAPGEGSSGVSWLGRDLLDTVLTHLVPGGLIITDGSCVDPDGPEGFRQFYNVADMGLGAIFRARGFRATDRCRLECRGYAGEGRGPTLVWQFTPTDT